PLRVPEVHIRPVVKESLGRGKAAPLDGAEKRRLVLGHGIHARPATDQQVDRVHVVLKRGGPETVLGSRSLLHEPSRYRRRARAGWPGMALPRRRARRWRGPGRAAARPGRATAP